MNTYYKLIYKLLSVVLLLNVNLNVAFSQKINLKAVTDSIQTEGRMLYRSEMASWYGTDIFFEKMKNKKGMIGGYISYDTGKGVNNVFITKGNEDVVLSTITFGYDFNVNNYVLDTIQRKLTAAEKDLFNMRKAALNALNTDTLFKYYNNSSFNIIPIIDKKVRRTYIISGPKVVGVIILGNDYVIEFDKNNNIINKKKIHRNILPFETKVGDDQMSAVHSHLASTGDFITATDICTLMLYKNSTGWKTHTVISKNYVTIWDMQKGGMGILTREAWDKISSDNKAVPSKQ